MRKSSILNTRMGVEDLDNTYLESNYMETAKPPSSPSAFDNARIITYPLPPSAKFLTNSISTSKYSLITWVPKSLFYQFRRIANIYFLMISILSAQYFSPKNPFTMAGTFGAVLFFTMLKEAYEDLSRHKQDKLVNSQICHRFNNTTQEIDDIQSREVKVGDILHVKSNEYFPADLVFLSSSNVKGLGFVNTMNLDGEVNLKEKTAVSDTSQITSPEKLGELAFQIECDHPNISLVKWNCNFELNSTEKQPLSQKHLLLRGCSLQNTDFINGIVIYTGHESKIMLNSKSAPSKSSNVLRKMNKILYTVFGFQLCMCFLLAGLSVHWQETEDAKHTYLSLSAGDMGLAYFIQVLTYLVAYSHLIPISLYVALEIVKLALAYLISQDLFMFYQGRAAACRASDLVEELGQVEFVFSDKTGTLTCNEMIFRRCEVNGVVYGSMKQDFAAKNSEELEAFQNPRHTEHKKMRTFFEFMAVCHSVFPATTPGTEEIMLQASSPDELALVEASKAIGTEFFERSEGKVRLRDRTSKEITTWEVLVEVPFNSDRKRMSVVARNPNTKQYVLMTKGADSMMLPLVSDSPHKQKLASTLYNFAVEGLRTLVMGQRVMADNEFLQWFAEWKQVLLSNDTEKERKLDQLGARIEKNLELVGCSAIEDKLQDGVPQAIELLMSAGIRVWVLTGDKEETAIEIGKSCNLLQQHMEVVKLSSNSHAEISEKLQKFNALHKLELNSFPQLEVIKKKLPRKIAIVIDGLTLTWVFEDAFLKKTFFKLGFLSVSCICCRVSPAQKMQVVQLAKSSGGWVTLSIGDGANDVSMIQEAHIGVGISGKEGAQAVQAADFSFSQFKFLTRLLLIHGRWAYRRISWFICYYFYKNITVVFAELWFALFNGFSGQIYFMDWLPMLYNSFWTSWPCMIAYLLEQDVDAYRSLKYPNLYKAGQKGMYFNVKRFWVWAILGIWHGSVCFWGPILVFSTASSSDGIVHHQWWVSTVSFSLVIHTVTIKLYLENMHWNLFSL